MQKISPVPVGANLSEFIPLLRDAIKSNMKLRCFLKTNKKDNFLYEDCFFTVDANVRDLHETYKEANVQNLHQDNK